MVLPADNSFEALLASSNGQLFDKSGSKYTALVLACKKNYSRIDGLLIVHIAFSGKPKNFGL
jgi:hypothetical protein